MTATQLAPSETKLADNNYELHPLIQARWSPRAFSETSLDTATLGSLLEAARWAPSSFNEQPWRFVVGSRAHNPQTLEMLQSFLVDGNSWAKKAAVLILGCSKKSFSLNGHPNHHYAHDLGLALGNMSLQATALGLQAHMMAGFKKDEATQALSLPPDYEAITMIAIGHVGEASSLSEAWQQQAEEAPRERKALQDLLMDHSFGQVFASVYSS